MRSIYMKLAETEGGATGVTIATVISTSGSTPVKAGSSALFSSNGLLYGTVGGGVLEGRVTGIAKEYAGSGLAAIHQFDFDNDISKTNEAICGGKASVLIDGNAAKDNNIFRELKELDGKRVRAVLATEISVMESQEMKLSRSVFPETYSGNGADEFSKAIIGDVKKLLSPESKDSFTLVELKNVKGSARHLALLETVFPRKHLVIAGAGHIGKVLCHLGSLLDFEVTVLDDRPEYANKLNLPDADNIITGDIGTEMSKIRMGQDTYIVIVTRGHNDDSNALKACIGTHAAYIGMIGSRTKIEKMKRNFLENGWTTPEIWASVHTPIGLQIGSESVEEIALSIAAELVLVRNKKKVK